MGEDCCLWLSGIKPTWVEKKVSTETSSTVFLMLATHCNANGPARYYADVLWLESKGCGHVTQQYTKLESAPLHGQKSCMHVPKLMPSHAACCA